LRAFLPGESVPPPYEEAAARAGLSVAAFNSEIHRLRGQFRECVFAEVTGTVSAPHEIDEELAHLYRVLMDRGTDFRAAGES
jgi:RNA polymerase sigma-70 factor (ECF subfamily)